MAFTGLLLRSQMLAHYGDNLRGQYSYRLFLPEDDRVSRYKVVRPMPLDDAEHIPAQERAATGGDAVPTERIEIVDTIGENETKASRKMPVAMPLAQIIDG